MLARAMPRRFAPALPPAPVLGMPGVLVPDVLAGEVWLSVLVGVRAVELVFVMLLLELLVVCVVFVVGDE